MAQAETHWIQGPYSGCVDILAKVLCSRMR